MYTISIQLSTGILGNPIIDTVSSTKLEKKSPFGEYKATFSLFLNAEVLLHDVFISELPKGYKIDSSQIFQDFISAIFFLHSEDWVQTL